MRLLFLAPSRFVRPSTRLFFQHLHLTLVCTRRVTYMTSLLFLFCPRPIGRQHSLEADVDIYPVTVGV